MAGTSWIGLCTNQFHFEDCYVQKYILSRKDWKRGFYVQKYILSIITSEGLIMLNINILVCKSVCIFLVLSAVKSRHIICHKFYEYYSYLDYTRLVDLSTRFIVIRDCYSTIIIMIPPLELKKQWPYYINLQVHDIKQNS